MKLTNLRCKDAQALGTFWDHGDYGVIRAEGFDKAEFFHPNYFAYSDYSGGTVEMANLRAWEQEFPEGDGEWWHVRTGHHGSRELCITIDACPVEAIEIFCAVSEYPLMSEDIHSQLELELWEEGKEGACWDIRRELTSGGFEQPIKDMLDRLSDRVILAFWADWEADDNEHNREFEGLNPRYPVVKIAGYIADALELHALDQALMAQGETAE